MGDAHARLQRPDGGGRPLTLDALLQEADRQADKQRPKVPVRDAATLVVVDDERSPPKILVGRRSAAHVFMAAKIVFPGGRVDPSDLRLANSHALPEASLGRLLSGVRARFDARRAAALALAAIRETWEETGVMIGRADPAFRCRLPVWADFAEAGIAPDPSVLVPFARAITPPHQVRRFDTRFFAVRASAIARTVPLEDRPTDEFDRVAWMSVADLLAEPLARITRQVLGDLDERLTAGSLFDASVAMPGYRRQGNAFRRDLL